MGYLSGTSSALIEADFSGFQKPVTIRRLPCGIVHRIVVRLHTSLVHFSQRSRLTFSCEWSCETRVGLDRARVDIQNAMPDYSNENWSSTSCLINTGKAENPSMSPLSVWKRAIFTACALLAVTLFTTSCQTVKRIAATQILTFEMTEVERGGDAKELDSWSDHVSTEEGVFLAGESIRYEDNLLEVDFNKTGEHKYFTLAIENKSSSDIKIDWEKVKFIYLGKSVNNVLVDGAKIEGKFDG